MTNAKPATRGAAIREKLMGAEMTRDRDERLYVDPVMRTFVEVTNVTVFENIWGRPGLDLKTRTMITLVSDVAGGRFPELETHIKLALRQGWTKDEIMEAILHLLAYNGAPLVRSALLIAVDVFNSVASD